VAAMITEAILGNRVNRAGRRVQPTEYVAKSV